MILNSILLAGLAGALAVEDAAAPDFGKDHALGCYANYVLLLDREGAQIPRIAPGEQLDVLSEESAFWSARFGMFMDSKEDAELQRQVAGGQRALSLARTTLTTGPDAARQDMTGALARCRADRAVITDDQAASVEPSDG
ncbi:MAG: hypothetical protein ACFE0P_15975 [Oceanicaulis sp.]